MKHFARCAKLPWQCTGSSNHEAKMLNLDGLLCHIPGRLRFTVDLAHLYIVWHLLFMQNTIIACQDAIHWVLLNRLWVAWHIYSLSGSRGCHWCCYLGYDLKVFQGVLPLTALNVWRVPPLKQIRRKQSVKNRWTSCYILMSINTGTRATLTFLLTPSNLAWEVIRWMMDVLLFYYVDSSTGSQTVCQGFFL